MGPRLPKTASGGLKQLQAVSAMGRRRHCFGWFLAFSARCRNSRPTPAAHDKTAWTPYWSGTAGETRTQRLKQFSAV
eukprot:1254172-Alexandrium_andersonii.AAC.1